MLFYKKVVFFVNKKECVEFFNQILIKFLPKKSKIFIKKFILFLKIFYL